MSPKGKWVLIGGEPENKGNLAGLVMADIELSKFYRLDYATSHADVGLDSQGREVIVMQNIKTDYLDLIPLEEKTKPILESNGTYKNTNRIPLVRLYYDDQSPKGLKSGLHVSCNSAGYCVVSTYIGPDQKESNWLDRTIILIKLDREKPKVFYLAKVHNTTQEYWEETQATISNDGSKIVWASNWNHYVGKEQVFLLQLDLPNNWVELSSK